MNEELGHATCANCRIARQWARHSLSNHSDSQESGIRSYLSSSKAMVCLFLGFSPKIGNPPRRCSRDRFSRMGRDRSLRQGPLEFLDHFLGEAKPRLIAPVSRKVSTWGRKRRREREHGCFIQEGDALLGNTHIYIYIHIQMYIYVYIYTHICAYIEI